MYTSTSFTSVNFFATKSKIIVKQQRITLSIKVYIIRSLELRATVTDVSNKNIIPNVEKPQFAILKNVKIIYFVSTSYKSEETKKVAKRYQKKITYTFFHIPLKFLSQFTITIFFSSDIGILGDED